MGRGAVDAAEFPLNTGPGPAIPEPGRHTRGQARARHALTGHLRRHEAADGTVRLRGTSWLVTADRPTATA
ncbi:hypothetical protein ACIQ1J_32415 [Streptomyces sp. NPDC097107]|uniref:hypothetical protein n=1 Tax=Streptomyces sp. NPDC097107 TaxID=3366089 RepID=UPI0038143CF2